MHVRLRAVYRKDRMSTVKISWSVLVIAEAFLTELMMKKLTHNIKWLLTTENLKLAIKGKKDDIGNNTCL